MQIPLEEYLKKKEGKLLYHLATTVDDVAIVMEAQDVGWMLPVWCQRFNLNIQELSIGRGKYCGKRVCQVSKEGLYELDVSDKL